MPHIAHEMFQVVELLVVLHEPGDRRAAFVGQFRPDIDDHQRAQRTTELRRSQQHRVAAAHRVADQDRLSKPIAAMNASASSDISWLE